MALVNTDLFLVQDASTKTNYKISYANLASDISSDIVDDIDFSTEYVNETGDNMTGDLTLGPVNTTKITLNANAGDGTFTGTVYGNYLKAGTSLTGTGGLLIYGDASSTNSIALETNGNVNIGGDVTASAFIGDGSNLTNLPATSSIWGETDNDIAPLTLGRNIINIADITISGDLDSMGTVGAIQISGTNINSSGNITGNASVNAGTGDNVITLDGSTGEITGGPNVFIDCGTYS